MSSTTELGLTPSAPHASLVVDPVDGRQSFPPFPQVPASVTIIPFKSFKERGIQIFATDGDDVERDGLGIPTVELRSQHDTDVCKSNAQRKRKKKSEVARAGGGTTVRKEWWEQWNQTEDLRLTSSYNPNTSPIDRLYDAANAFRRGRPWPPGTAGISYMWDQFRLFAGLLSNMPIWRRTDQPSDNDSDEDMDDEFASETNVNVGEGEASNESNTHRPRPRPRARPPYATYGTDPIPVSSDAEVRDLLDEESDRKEEKVISFLNDPEDRMRIFLSSYMRKQGLIWSDRNLIGFPRLLGFFVRFLLRNRVFPESTHDRGLRRCLDVIELAQKELILTSKLAKAVPDNFSMACKKCWGPKADGYKWVPPVVEQPEWRKDEDKRGKDDKDTEEPDLKKPKFDTSQEQEDSTLLAAKIAVDRFEETLKAAHIEVIKNDAILTGAAANNGTGGAPNPTTEGTSENSTWGTWGQSGEYDPSSFTPSPDPWATQAVNWDPPMVYSLLPMLGPTALPLTHTTGITEWSVRRVKSVAAPPAPGTLPRSAVTPGEGAEEDPGAVELELVARFGKVVLEPWVDWDEAGEEMAHLSKPRILETSRGPVVDSGVGAEGGQMKATNGGEATDANVIGAMRPHDPYKDDITLLVEPVVFDALSIGLGIGGTWVQIARQQDLPGEGGEEEPAKKKKKKGKSNKVTERYWYVDEVILILPSYHTPETGVRS